MTPSTNLLNFFYQRMEAGDINDIAIVEHQTLRAMRPVEWWLDRETSRLVIEIEPAPLSEDELLSALKL